MATGLSVACPSYVLRNAERPFRRERFVKFARNGILIEWTRLVFFFYWNFVPENYRHEVAAITIWLVKVDCGHSTQGSAERIRWRLAAATKIFRYSPVLWRQPILVLY